MNSLRLLIKSGTLGLLVIAILAAACTRQSGESSGPAPGGADLKAPAPTLQGTVSGGGGNGCDGKAFEAYAQKISNFLEFRLYIKPILRRMVEGGNDPLASYLTWVAEEKVWYFIPCQLERLSKEQIGLAIESDQLARHGEHGIYIFGDKDDENPVAEAASNSRKKHYFNQRLKARAALLLHEMVMGARLLMKKSAKEQCKSLARMEADLCSNQELMAIAESIEIDPAQAMVMNADDHEAVRAMTTYLADRGSDVSADKIWQTRQRLKFHFPWDRAVSRLDMAGLAKAFARSHVDRDTFAPKSKTPYFGDMEAACTIYVHQESDDKLSIELHFATGLRLATTSYEKLQEFMKLSQANSYSHSCTATRGRVVPEPWWKASYCEDQVLSWQNLETRWYLAPAELAVRGVLRDGQILDEITLMQMANRHDFRFKGAKPDVLVAKLYVTREARPKINAIVIEPKGLLRDGALRATSQTERPPVSASNGMNGELYDIQELAPLECHAQSAAAASQQTR